MSRFVKLAGVLGFSVALLLSIAWRIYNGSNLLRFSPSADRMMENITLFVWPFSFMLMATEGAGALMDVFTTVLAILLNALLYMLVAYVIHEIYKRC